MNLSTFLIFPLLICTAGEVNYAPSSTARLFSLHLEMYFYFGEVTPNKKGTDLSRAGQGVKRSGHHPSEPCTCSSPTPQVLWMTAWLTLQECSGPGVPLFSPAVPFMPQNEVWKEILSEIAPPSLPVHPSFFTSSLQALSQAHIQVAQYNSKTWAFS